MKNFYDLSLEKQKKLKKEFQKKYGSIKKGIIIGSCISIIYLIIRIGFNDIYEEYFKIITGLLIIITIITMIVTGVHENNAFKNWLKSRNIIK